MASGVASCAVPQRRHVGPGEPGADLRLMQVPGDAPVALDGHHGMDVRLAVDDFAGGGHLGRLAIAGEDVLGGVSGGGSGNAGAAFFREPGPQRPGLAGQGAEVWPPPEQLRDASAERGACALPEARFSLNASEDDQTEISSRFDGRAGPRDVTHRLARRERDVAAVCRRTRLCWAKRRPTGELPMTAPHARQPQLLPRPACTPTAIRAVLAANADGDILERYDEDLDAAFEQAREQGDVTPLVQTVKRWWFEADAWRDPQVQREFLARIDTYRDEGPLPSGQRMSREEIRAQFGV